MGSNTTTTCENNEENMNKVISRNTKKAMGWNNETDKKNKKKRINK